MNMWIIFLSKYPEALSATPMMKKKASGLPIKDFLQTSLRSKPLTLFAPSTK